MIDTPKKWVKNTIKMSFKLRIVSESISDVLILLQNADISKLLMRLPLVSLCWGYISSSNLLLATVELSETPD